MDNIRIYDRALSAGEIKDLFDLEKPSNKTASVTPKPGTLLWEFETGGWVMSAPAIGTDGTIYFGSYDKKVYALNPNGTKRWEFETGDIVFSSPSLGPDGTVYVGSVDKKVYALNGKTGEKIWEFETHGSVNSSPAIGIDNTIYKLKRRRSLCIGR